MKVLTAWGTVTVEKRDNGFCYWATETSPDSWSGPVCSSPDSWPTDDLAEAATLVREALA